MGYGYSITINTSYRARLFVDATAVRTALACLQDAAAKYSARVFAYCFMPDHIHLLAQTPPGVDFTEFIRSFKQRSGFALKTQLDRSRSGNVATMTTPFGRMKICWWRPDTSGATRCVLALSLLQKIIPTPGR
jgi:REP element-mobilizing transposase RayT